MLGFLKDLFGLFTDPIFTPREDLKFVRWLPNDNGLFVAEVSYKGHVYRVASEGGYAWFSLKTGQDLDYYDNDMLQAKLRVRKYGSTDSASPSS